PPLKKVEWKLKLGAGLGHTGPRLSVHVNLPRQRSERGEVVLSRPRLDPGQAVTTADGPGHAHAQWAVAIVDAGLRHGVEEEAAHRDKAEQQRGDPWNQPRTHPPSDSALFRHQGECAVGGGHQLTREADSLRLVG